MDISIFLAKVIGVYMIILGIVVLKKPHLGKVLNELSDDESSRFIISLFTIILGLILVNVHNIWVGGYKIVITIVAWVALLKGVGNLLLSEKNFRHLVDRANTPQMLKLSGVINLVVGIYLTYIGYFI
jgi:hypothetical protein